MNSASITRRRAAALISAAAWSQGVRAQAPPLKVIVGFPAGGGGDLLARAVAERLQEALGRPVIVENRPGAGGMIAAQFLKTQPGDGNTVMMANDHQAVMVPLTMKAAGYGFADFVPVAEVAMYRHAFCVGPATTAATLKDQLDRARADKAQANVGIPAPGSQAHFIAWVLGQASGAPLNIVPYRGGAPLNADLLGGQLPASVDALGSVAPLHRERKLRVLAISGVSRSALLPEVPAFEELGFKGLDRDGWAGLVAPAGTPPDIVRNLDGAVRRALATDELKAKLSAMGFEPAFADARAMAGRVQRDESYWADVIKRAGFQPQ
jgi:tripartite-type tricarboxylate transporter receptor subunit TctC